MPFKLNMSARIQTTFLLSLFISFKLIAAGPAPVDLLSTAPFAILSGAGITSTGGGNINGDVGASPITGAAIGVTCAQVIGTIYAVDASGPPCAVIDSTLLTTAKGDLTTAYNDAAGRVPVPTGPNLNPGLIPGSGNIGGMNLAPGLYKFTSTALITGSDVTFTGGADDVWIFQCAVDLQVGSGIKIILAGGAQAKNIFWQVGTSAVLGTSSVFEGNILADQSITMNTASTIDGRLLASSAGVVFDGTSAILPVSPEIGVQQPAGTNLIDGVSSTDFGMVLLGTNTSLTFIITNSGDGDLIISNLTIDGTDAALFTVTTNPASLVGPNSNTTFTVQFTPLTNGMKTAVLHISNNDSDENPFDITLTGTAITAPVPEIGVQQPAGTSLMSGVSSEDFGLVLVGTNSSLTFIITNSGTANLTGLGITIDGLNASQFNVTTNPVAPVGPNASTVFSVQFAPTNSGVKTAALHIASNDTNKNPFNLTITGTGTTVAAPDIGVSQPPGNTLTNGVGTENFDPALVGASSSLTFTITNTGTANLTGLTITIDGVNGSQFSVTANPVTPVSPNGSTTFTVGFTPTSAGMKTAALHIASNDNLENPFNINLTGTGTITAAPEIGVQQPAGTDLIDGVSSKDFGMVVAGANTSLTFIITNTGTANLTGLGITIDGVDSALFTVTTNPIAPVTPNGSTIFIVTFAPLSTGVKTAALHIANNDSDENPFDISLTGTGTGGAIVSATNVFLIAVSPITLNPQTGLFEQTVLVTNSSASTVAAVRLLVQSLPVDVQVYNASGITNGFPYLQYNFPLAPATTLSFLVEYYRASRQAIPSPVFVVQATAAVSVTATGPIESIDRDVVLTSGRFLIEFTSVTGEKYAIQYSTNNMASWITVIPSITAPANRVQWYDDGPPKTISKPGSSGSRFYRVIQLP
jgi:hypothetical protein